MKMMAVKNLMGIFRAVVLKREYSQRALDLSEELLDLNPANYTIWYLVTVILHTIK